MSQFWVYFELGLDHVLDWQAYDHVLFIVVLVASYGFTTWKRVLGLVTLFTVGHTLALFLSVYKILKVDPNYVEFLIPITILATAIFDIATAGKKVRNTNYNLLYFTTAFFGLVHGLGFSSYFKMIASGTSNKFWPLVEFALGIEAAQILVVLAVMIIGFVCQNLLKVSKRDWIIVTASIVIGVILPILQETYLAL